MEFAKVSVITIVRNDSLNIEKTMHSILAQTYKNYEYIIKDGLSTDGTQEIIERVREKNPKSAIKFVSCKDSGIYDAMNQAVSYCTGEWICFINSGDAFADENVLFEIFKNDRNFQGAGVLYGDAIVRDETGDAIWKADLSKIEKKMPFCHQSCFVKRCYATQYPFDTGLRIASDYNQILDLYVNEVIFEKLDRVIAIFELDGVSSTKFIDRFKERNLVIANHGFCNKGKISLMFEYIMEGIKTILVKIMPRKVLNSLKQWYKVNIRHYEIR